MKLLIADKFEQSGINALTALGCSVALHPDCSGSDLPGVVTSEMPDVLIVRSTKVSAEAMDACPGMNLIIRAGAGYDTIDVQAASARGVFVSNCPGKNAIAVAELTWGHILCCDRRIPDQTAELKAGTWNKKEYSKAAGLHGRVLGIVGLGDIGREVAARGRAFGMRVVAWSRSLTPESAAAQQVEFAASPLEVARQADVVSVHVAATNETKRLINDAFIEAMKPGAFLINTSRGSVADEAAIEHGIKAKGIRAGLDVFNNEPGAADNRFACAIATQPGVSTTHHIGASTEQAQEAIAAEVTRIVSHYLRTGAAMNCVNLAKSTPAVCVLTVRMKNEPGVLAHVFYLLGQGRLNVEEMDNVVYDGAKAACAHIQLDKAPDDEILKAIRANNNVVSATVAMLKGHSI
ncbi:MAG: 3-phosphoglycerate dehydrogenase family protein [Phycisphaerales bacterium]